MNKISFTIPNQTTNINVKPQTIPNQTTHIHVKPKINKNKNITDYIKLAPNVYKFC